MPYHTLPLVLIPGFMLDDRLWDALIPHLPEGRPHITASLREGDTIEAIAENIIQTLPPRFILLGFSMGGYVARAIVNQFPERVAALILVATSLRPDTPERKKMKENAVMSIGAGEFKGLTAKAISRSLHPSQKHNEPLIRNIQEMGIRLGREVFVRQSSLVRENIPVSSIQCPTLVIAADRDQLRGSEETEAVATAIPHSTFALIPDCGHMIPLEQPEALASVVTDWVESLT